MNDDSVIWAQIRSSMAVEGYEVSDQAFEEIKRSYRVENRNEVVQRLLLETSNDHSIGEFKELLTRITSDIKAKGSL